MILHGEDGGALGRLGLTIGSRFSAHVCQNLAEGHGPLFHDVGTRPHGVGTRDVRYRLRHMPLEVNRRWQNVYPPCQ